MMSVIGYIEDQETGQDHEVVVDEYQAWKVIRCVFGYFNQNTRQFQPEITSQCLFKFESEAIKCYNK
mgnify:CR=1 FL=1